MRSATRLAAAALIAAIAVALGVGLTGRGRDVLLDDAPGCLLKLVTGVDCPFCGMTHATVALGAGDLAGAHGFHPLALIVVAGLIAVLGLIAAGRAELLLRGRMPIVLLGAIVAIWTARLIA